MELGAIFASAFVVAFSGAMMPGPLLTVTISETARRGFVAGPLIMIGHAILEIALILALAAGLSVFLTKTSVMQAIAILGGIFLLYMGYGMGRDAWIGKVSLSVKSEIDSSMDQRVVTKGMNPIWAGILVSLSNPFWSIWWATVGLGYITLALKQGFMGMASFFSGHILADSVWYLLIAAAVAGGRNFLNDKIYRGILLVCAAFLIGLGIYFLYTGLLVA